MNETINTVNRCNSLSVVDFPIFPATRGSLDLEFKMANPKGFTIDIRDHL